MEDQKKPDDEEEELISAFSVFDSDDKGHIEAAELRELLANMDDKMPEKELKDLLQFTHLDKERTFSFDGENFKKLIQIMANSHFLAAILDWSAKSLSRVVGVMRCA